MEIIEIFIEWFIEKLLLLILPLFTLLKGVVIFLNRDNNLSSDSSLSLS